jgi:hypothetical protein
MVYGSQSEQKVHPMHAINRMHEKAEQNKIKHKECAKARFNLQHTFKPVTKTLKSNRVQYDLESVMMDKVYD